MATTRIKDLSKTATTVNSDANLVLDGNTGGTQKISRDNFRQDTADAFVAAPGTYNLAPLNSGTGKIDAVYLSSSSDSPKGAWDASSNTPTLADGTGTAGDYYDVTVAGSSDLGSGSITFTVGDVVKYNGTVWFKIDSVANILDGVSTIDGAKSAIEIPDVGTDPSQVPLNQHLGTMAYQSSDGVSMGNAEVETLEVTDKVTGQLGVGASPSYDLHVTNTSSSASIGITGTGGSKDTWTVTSSDGGGKALLNFRDEDTANTVMSLHQDGRVGIGTASPSGGAIGGKVVHVQSTGETASVRVDRSDASTAGTLSLTAGNTTVGVYGTGTKDLAFSTNGTTRWTISGATGNLVANGTAIDFGSTTTGTGTPSGGLLSDYEEGTFTVTTNGDATGVIAGQYGEYTKIGRLVTVRITFQVTTDFTDNLIGGLPFQVDAPNTGGSSVSTGGIVFSSSGNGSPLTCHTNDNTTTVSLLSGTSVATNHQPNTSNSTYRIQFSYNTD